jgi:hypothetical protein
LEDSKYDIKFKVDYITILLIIVAAIPLLAEFIEVIKGKDFELRLRSRKFRDNVLTFLEDSARVKLWTFYGTRENESSLGDTFRALVSDLLEDDRQKLIETLRRWLKSNDDQLKWLAAEIIGHFKISELASELSSLYDLKNKTGTWLHGELNCLWAYSRFSNYEDLKNFLLETTDPKNQTWVLFSYEQMVRAREATPDEFKSSINNYLKKNPPDEQKKEAHRVLKFLEEVSAIEK